MKCIGLCITKSSRSVVTEKDTGKRKYIRINFNLTPTSDKNKM